MVNFIMLCAMLSTICIGLRVVYQALSHRYNTAYHQVGSIRVPFWTVKAAIGLGIIFIGVYGGLYGMYGLFNV